MKNLPKKDFDASLHNLPWQLKILILVVLSAFVCLMSRTVSNLFNVKGFYFIYWFNQVKATNFFLMNSVLRIFTQWFWLGLYEKNFLIQNIFF